MGKELNNSSTFVLSIYISYVRYYNICANTRRFYQEQIRLMEHPQEFPLRWCFIKWRKVEKYSVQTTEMAINYIYFIIFYCAWKFFMKKHIYWKSAASSRNENR